MQVERYRIVLTGWVLTGYQIQEVVADLSHLFRIPQDRIRPLLLVGGLVAAMVWGYFAPSNDGYHSDLTPSVFTFPPAKSIEFGDGYRKSVQQ